MTPRQAPEIFQLPLAELDLADLPPRGSPEFEQAVIGRYALEYAARGWNAVVTVDDAFVRVLAVPERGVEPKAYVLGLLEHGFLDDALPLLEALDGMLEDVDIAYNHGLCLSELGRVPDAVAPRSAHDGGPGTGPSEVGGAGREGGGRGAGTSWLQCGDRDARPLHRLQLQSQNPRRPLLL